MRHRVLPLYFSRPISRLDYVLSKLAALTIALLALTLLPVLLLFVGHILAAEDVVGALGDEIGALPDIIGNGLLHAIVLASIGLAICAVAGRRAYAAGAVLALFLIGSVTSGIFQEQGGGLAGVAPFVHPLAILDGAREWLFGGTVDGSPVTSAGVPLPLYGLAVLVVLGACWLVLAIRYRSVTT
jgi:ABC-2 type transport system permease protein